MGAQVNPDCIQSEKSENILPDDRQNTIESTIYKGKPMDYNVTKTS